MTTVALPRRTPVARMRWFMSDILVLTRRNLAHVKQVPEKLIDVTLQPVMFVLLFAFVFGGVVDVKDGNYREYLLGGIFIQTLAFGMTGPGTALASDLTAGIVDRVRSMSVSRTAFLLGHFVSGLAARVLSLVALGLAGLLVGWQTHTDLLHVLGGVALLLLFAVAMMWVGMLVGTLVRTPDAVMGVAFLVIFPLTFLSNAFVPAGGLAGGLQTVAKYNPISAVAAGVRTLFGNPTALPADPGWALQHPVLSATLWSIGIAAIAAPLAIWRYRARTTG